MKTKEPCVHCKAPGRQAYCRGLCQPCYKSAYWLVATGKTTWAALVAAGAALAGVPKGRPRSAATTAMLAAVQHHQPKEENPCPAPT